MQKDLTALDAALAASRHAVPGAVVGQGYELAWIIGVRRAYRCSCQQPDDVRSSWLAETSSVLQSELALAG